MMYIAKKPCHLGGKQCFIGDLIPPEFIAPGNEARLVSMGLIEPMPDKQPETPLSADATPEQENTKANADEAVDGVKQPDNAKIEAGKKKEAAQNSKRGGNGGKK